MSWRYRVMRQHYEHDDEPDIFAIHEVYDDGGWTEHAAGVSAESVDELRELLTLMALAVQEPVLDHATGEPVDATDSTPSPPG